MKTPVFAAAILALLSQTASAQNASGAVKPNVGPVVIGGKPIKPPTTAINGATLVKPNRGVLGGKPTTASPITVEKPLRR